MLCRLMKNHNLHKLYKTNRLQAEYLYVIRNGGTMDFERRRFSRKNSLACISRVAKRWSCVVCVCVALLQKGAMLTICFVSLSICM